jgi:hypothetical protein
MQSMSSAVPFLKKPAALDGSMVGDVGFDPLGLSEVADIKFLREAELKHGRIAMLAAAGSMAQDLFTFPGVGKVVAGAKMTGVHDILVKQGAMGQLLLWLSFLEVFGTIALFETLEGKRAPGDFKFDPLNFSKNDATAKRYALAEVKNGRLAMMGIGGMVHGAPRPNTPYCVCSFRECVPVRVPSECVPSRYQSTAGEHKWCARE